MPTLHDRLADLADEVSEVTPPRGLFAAERRRLAVVRRHTALVAAAALALVGLLLGGSWWARQPATPVSQRGEVGLPDRIYEPSRWLPTAHDGELGQLVAVLGTQQGTWWRSRPGVVGVSAATGEYAFLNLPDLAEEQVAVAPDGRAVAYWTTGTPSGSPNLDEGGRTITGVAVLDTNTGEVRRSQIPTEHGLSPSQLVFVSPDSLWISYGQYLAGVGDRDDDQGTSLRQPVELWRLGEDVRAPVALPAGVSDEVVTARNGLVWTGNRLVDLSDAADPGSRKVSARVPGIGMGSLPRAALSADGRWLATMGAAGLPDRLPNRVAVYDLQARGKDGRCCGTARVLTGSAGSWATIGWRDSRHLVLLQQTGEPQPLGPLSASTAAVELDLVTGERREVVVFSKGDTRGPPDWQFAVDLLTAPTVPGREPPQPWDPRLVMAGVGSVLLGAWLVVIRTRRRHAGG